MNKVVAVNKFYLTSVTVRKWGKRYVSEGESGLNDRSSLPHNTAINANKKSGGDNQIKEEVIGNHIACELDMHQGPSFGI